MKKARIFFKSKQSLISSNHCNTLDDEAAYGVYLNIDLYIYCVVLDRNGIHNNLQNLASCSPVRPSRPIQYCLQKRPWMDS